MSSHRRYVLALFLAVLFCCSFVYMGGQPQAQEQELFEYYGVVPPTKYLSPEGEYYPYFVWPNGTIYYPQWLNGSAYLDIVGVTDDTSVEVYDITEDEPRLLHETTINRMELKTFTLMAGTAFKVVSDMFVAVTLNGGTGSWYWAGGHLFYPSTDGGFAGKEFIFMALPSSEPPEMPRKSGDRHAIHAIDDAEVSLYDDKGNLVKTYSVKANRTSLIDLSRRTVSRVVSTGRIMVATWDWSGYTVLPNAFGGFKGKRFLTEPDAIDAETAAVAIIAQEKPCKVTIYDTDSGAILVEEDLAAYELLNVNKDVVDLIAKSLLIMATEEVLAFTASATDTGLITDFGDDITFLGLEPGPSTVYIVTKGYLFAPEGDTEVWIGPIPQIVKKGTYTELPSGLVKLRTNATTILELLALHTFTVWAEPPNIVIQGDGLDDWATYLVPTQTVSITYPPAVGGGEGGLELPIAEIAGAVILVVIVIAVWRPWRKRKPKT